ncbi:hypothetical protein IQ269_04240 [Tychonema sp. LEGE 07199]|uniref:hypothetical protein n=1 Tax=unclassified Tychonema TaxID=2642144 RepID=UPI00187F3B19|nr:MULTISPECIES: hypothetical protein [unclassified Tychonema]MBE9120031.1 hypothetical protein [Tychonema sp. LEGE 07199]MBE9132499.1 hypothetical protein [Tychonema sp. LEGE 07196]
MFDTAPLGKKILLFFPQEASPASIDFLFVCKALQMPKARAPEWGRGEVRAIDTP